MANSALNPPMTLLRSAWHVIPLYFTNRWIFSLWLSREIALAQITNKPLALLTLLSDIYKLYFLATSELEVFPLFIYMVGPQNVDNSQNGCSKHFWKNNQFIFNCKHAILRSSLNSYFYINNTSRLTAWDPYTQMWMNIENIWVVCIFAELRLVTLLCFGAVVRCWHLI